MARILLIDGDSIATELAERLGPWKHSVTVCCTAREGVAQLRARKTDFGIIALNMSRNRREDWEALAQICESIALCNREVKILCFSTAYWGPQMQLAIERKGSRFVYIG